MPKSDRETERYLREQDNRASHPPSSVKHIVKVSRGADGQLYLPISEPLLVQLGWDTETELEILTIFGKQMIVRKKDSLKG